MANIEDNLEWARRLGCPESALTESIKKTLSSGISSLIWDELASVLRPSKEVLETRKNILLYKLRNKVGDPSIQQIRNQQQLRAASSQFEPQIESLEKECEQKNLLLAQKRQTLLNVKRHRELINKKAKLLGMKYDQMQTQVKDCKDMRVVCQKSMPPTCREIDSRTVDESLSLVGEISTKAEKRMVWNRISETLATKEITLLWNILLSRRTRDTEELMALGTHEIADTERHAVITSGENINIGIARVCGEHIAGAVKTMIHRIKANKHEQLVMDYIKQIEELDTNNVDISEWLALSLEIRKLETEQSGLQSEIGSLQKTLEHQSELENELSNVESEIQSINTRVETCVLNIQDSMTLLNNASLDIARTNDALLLALRKIATLYNENERADYLDIDLGMELNTFFDTVQLEALRKMLLKDGVGAYRHTTCCISEAQRSITTPSRTSNTSQFPMIRAPIYELLNCYKVSIAASWLAKLENELETNERNDVDELMAVEMPDDASIDAIKILNALDIARDKVHEELRQFDSTYDAWKNQTVQKAMALNDESVNGATFKEWVKRFDRLIYMTRRKK